MYRANQSKRRRDPNAFEWHTNNDQPPPAVRMRHTDISLNDMGQSSVHNTHISAPASPTQSQSTPNLEPVYRDDYLLTQLFNQFNNGLGEMDVVNGFEEGETEGAEDEGVDPQYQQHLEDNDLEAGKPRRKRTAAVRTFFFAPRTHILTGSIFMQEHPLRKWLGQRDHYLLELIRRDGRGDDGSQCFHCHLADGLYRCIDCHGGSMLCRACMVSTHYTTPLHRIEVSICGLFYSVSITDAASTLDLEWPSF